MLVKVSKNVYTATHVNQCCMLFNQYTISLIMEYYQYFANLIVV